MSIILLIIWYLNLLQTHLQLCGPWNYPLTNTWMTHYISFFLFFLKKQRLNHGFFICQLYDCAFGHCWAAYHCRKERPLTLKKVSNSNSKSLFGPPSKPGPKMQPMRFSLTLVSTHRRSSSNGVNFSVNTFLNSLFPKKKKKMNV